MERTPQWPEEMEGQVRAFVEMRCRYQAALTEVKTKLDILNDEFRVRYSRNPIHHMESRVKEPSSIAGKLRRKGYEPTVENAMKHLWDIAGVRVVCAYRDDVYAIAHLLTSQDDIRLLRTRDYIKTPKANGYRSLHLIVEIPVFLSTGKQYLPVEVQIRTIAMDFWASLEHRIRYKVDLEVPEDLNRELYDAAQRIAEVDSDMQRIHDRMAALADKNGVDTPPRPPHMD
ncbi:MAG: GTP pyrophosphokinase family protein [Clostridiales bacterium]|nr:GTP pyrophosphokinase family protein [Clostridiales bacterium]